MNPLTFHHTHTHTQIRKFKIKKNCWSWCEILSSENHVWTLWFFHARSFIHWCILCVCPCFHSTKRNLLATKKPTQKIYFLYYVVFFIRNFSTTMHSNEINFPFLINFLVLLLFYASFLFFFCVRDFNQTTMRNGK